MKISTLFGKIIESEDKKKHGVIMAISCAKNVIEGYICFDENEKEFFVSASGTRVLKDKVIFKWLSREEKTSSRLRLGVPAFSQDGKFLGNVTDYSAVSGRICAVFICNKKYSAENLSVSDAVIVKQIVKQSVEKLQTEIAAKDMFINALCSN
ncbi:MAG: hypothetical protein ACI4MQ_05375 [Candidatus Coproplasma sp.]